MVLMAQPMPPEQLLRMPLYKKQKLLDLSAEEYLSNNDAYNFFSPLRDLIKTGPTRTNVMDVMIALVP